MRLPIHLAPPARTTPDTSNNVRNASFLAWISALNGTIALSSDCLLLISMSRLPKIARPIGGFRENQRQGTSWKLFVAPFQTIIRTKHNALEKECLFAW